MNENNYASLEASKRLDKAGIVLETDVWWYKLSSGWHLAQFPTKVIPPSIDNALPAPSMAEVWRELPPSIDHEHSTYNKTLKGFGAAEVAAFENLENRSLKHFPNINPTDALIDLLIWVTTRKEE